MSNAYVESKQCAKTKNGLWVRPHVQKAASYMHDTQATHTHALILLGCHHPAPPLGVKEEAVLCLSGRHVCVLHICN
jgi:hypothetical protein